MISASADAFFGYFLDAWTQNPQEQADRTAGNLLTMPVTVVQQDWEAVLGYEAATLWRAWASNLDHNTTSAGHFMAEEAPTEIIKTLRSLLIR